MKSKKLVCSGCGWETPELRELYSRFQEAVGDAQRFHEQNNKLKKAFDDNLRDYNKALGRIKELELAVVQAGIYGDRKLIECAEKDKRIKELEEENAVLKALNYLKL